MTSIKLQTIPPYGDQYPVADFLEDVQFGRFIDYDGFGQWATATHMSNVVVRPSDVVNKAVKPPRWATHVIWFNK